MRLFARFIALLSPQRGRAHELDRLKRAGRVSFGAGTYGTPEILSFKHDQTRLFVGNYTSIAEGACFLLGGNHPTDRVTTFPFRQRFDLVGAGSDGFPSSKGDIHVGSDAWIGHGVVVLSGAQIGDGAVVAAGSLVSGEVPAFAIAGGVPARVLSYRVDDDLIDALLQIKWWDWPEDVIMTHVHLLSAPLTRESVERLKGVAASLDDIDG